MTLPTLPMLPLVTIRNLRVELGGQEILRRLAAELTRHQITALVGLNGSGKTTLLRAFSRRFPTQAKCTSIAATIIAGPIRSMSAMFRKTAHRIQPASYRAPISSASPCSADQNLWASRKSWPRS